MRLFPAVEQHKSLTRDQADLVRRTSVSEARGIEQVVGTGRGMPRPYVFSMHGPFTMEDQPVREYFPVPAHAGIDDLVGRYALVCHI